MARPVIHHVPGATPEDDAPLRTTCEDYAGFWRLVSADIRRHVRRRPFFDSLHAVFRLPGVWVVVSYRMGHALHRTRWLRPLAAVYSQLVHLPLNVVCGIELPLTCRFGPGLKFHHWGGIVVHPRVRAGRNATIFHGVTIGRNLDSHRVPVLGDDVVIATGALIAGGVVVGDRVMVAANSVVTRDVPAGVTVGGAPARVIRQTGSERYVP